MDGGHGPFTKREFVEYYGGTMEAGRGVDRWSEVDVMNKFNNGNLAVHAFGPHLSLDPARAMVQGVPSLVEQMQEWHRTGSFWAGAPMSQIRPEYRDHPLFGQIGYIVDWTQCDVRAAAAFDLASDTTPMAGDWSSRMNELRRIRNKWAHWVPDGIDRIDHRRIAD